MKRSSTSFNGDDLGGVSTYCTNDGIPIKEVESVHHHIRLWPCHVKGASTAAVEPETGLNRRLCCMIFQVAGLPFFQDGRYCTAAWNEHTLDFNILFNLWNESLLIFGRQQQKLWRWSKWKHGTEEHQTWSYRSTDANWCTALIPSHRFRKA